MELKTTPGFHELIEVVGENQELVFTLKIPGNFTWEILHSVISAMGASAHKWQEMVQKQFEKPVEEVAQEVAQEVTPEVTEEVTPEIVS